MNEQGTTQDARPDVTCGACKHTFPENELKIEKQPVRWLCPYCGGVILALVGAKTVDSQLNMILVRHN